MTNQTSHQIGSTRAGSQTGSCCYRTESEDLVGYLKEQGMLRAERLYEAVLELTGDKCPKVPLSRTRNAKEDFTNTMSCARVNSINDADVLRDVTWNAFGTSTR